MRPDGQPPGAAGLVRVRRGDQPVGLGFLLPGNRVLTAAHVVNAALGRALDEPSKPDSHETLDLDFPFVAPETPVPARVHRWQAPAPAADASPAAASDLALLLVTGPLPDGARPLDLVEFAGGECELFGCPEGRPAGGWADVRLGNAIAGGRRQLNDLAGHGYTVAPGFSGGPVFPRDSAGVAGVVLVADERHRAGQCAPAAAVVAAFPDAGFVLQPAPAPRPDPPERKPISLPFQSLGGLFAGREADLERVHTALQDPGGHAALVGRVLHGLGGVGKTRLAVEYAGRRADAYTALLFTGAETPADLHRNLAALSGPETLDLPEQADPEEPHREAAVHRWLQDHPGWLLILDNLDTREAAAEAGKLVQSLRGGRVLLTGRYTQWAGNIRALELDTLAEEPAARFLLDRTEGRRRPQAADPDDARELARELGGLPLALEQAGAHIGVRRLTLRAYLAEWRAAEARVREWHDDALMQYPRSVAATWETTLQQLGSGEIALLRLLAWFAPEPIPLFLLETESAGAGWREAVTLLQTEPGAATGTPADALADLANYSMLRLSEDGQTCEVHRVVQEILRSRMAPEDRRVWLHLALRVLADSLPGDPQDVRTWPRWDLVRPHAAFLAAGADASAIPDPTATLMNQLALLLHARALHSDAEPLMRRALAIDEQSYGADHPEVARDLNNLAVLLHATNRLGEAEPLLRRALAIAARSLVGDHPIVAAALNNLGQLLQDTNRLEEAEPLMRRALVIFWRFTRITGYEHPHLAAAMGNYRHLLQAMGRSAGEIEAELRTVVEEAASG